jgi:hypothetical protein
MVSGCGGTTDIGLTPPSTGILSGKVMLYDGEGNFLTSDTGVTVTEATSSSSISTTTNDSGSWVFPKSFTGNFKLTFTKPGFGTVESFYDTVIANDTTKLPMVAMSEAPTDGLGLSEFEYVTPRNFIFTCVMPAPFSAPRSVVFCLSTDSAALLSNPSQAPWILDTAIAGNGYAGEFAFSSNTIVPSGSLTSGTIIYAVVCLAAEGQNYQSFSHYYDPVAKREVYTALGPHSRIQAVKIP